MDDTSAKQDSVTLFLGGDVMTGRGIDQILPHPGDTRLYESYVKDARDYVHIAEQVNGPIAQPVTFDYPWGDALAELDSRAPALRIINLETAITASGTAWPGKGIHYKMHPQNVACLSAAGIDCCVLANNHVLDWDYAGLAETLTTLHAQGITSAGAGRDLKEASAPAVLKLADQARVLVFSYGLPSSGVPLQWAAAADRAGINLLAQADEPGLRQVIDDIRRHRRQGDVVIASIHWGGNWGYEVESAVIEFAHGLVDEADVDVIHGHSSHHPQPLEIYNGKPIIYGCGDLLNDYEGIGGHAFYRPDLALMYFLSLRLETRRLLSLDLSAMQMIRFQLRRATPEDSRWLAERLSHYGAAFNTRLVWRESNHLQLSG